MKPVNTVHQPLSLDTACALLAHQHRRVILEHLQKTKRGTATLSELTTIIQTQVDEIESARHVQSVLLHQHLPKLTDHGLIDYDHRSETVRYHDDSQIERLLELGRFYK